MPNSFATSAHLTCSDCGQAFQADVWLIVDSSERSDLLNESRNDSIHNVPCPHCSQMNRVAAPLLLYRPELVAGGLSDSPLIFVGSANADAAAEQQQVGQLLGMLCASLGVQWRDSWLRDVPGLPADFALSGDRRAALESPLLRLLGDFINADTWNASQRIVEEHPELLSDEADGLLSQLLDAQDDEQNRQILAEHRALLGRCREIGIAAAFAERTAPSPETGEGRGGGIPPQFAADLRTAQEAEQRYRQGGGLPVLTDCRRRCLEPHPGPPGFCCQRSAFSPGRLEQCWWCLPASLLGTGPAGRSGPCPGALAGCGGGNAS